MMELRQTDEGIGYVNLALSEATRGGRGRRSILRRILHRRIDDGGSTFDNPKTRTYDDADAEANDVVVLASGNLGVISFPQWKERLSLEQLDAAFPRLIPGLVDHPGIAWRSCTPTSRARWRSGRTGIHFLETGGSRGRTRWRHSDRTRRGT